MSLNSRIIQARALIHWRRTSLRTQRYTRCGSNVSQFVSLLQFIQVTREACCVVRQKASQRIGLTQAHQKHHFTGEELQVKFSSGFC